MAIREQAFLLLLGLRSGVSALSLLGSLLGNLLLQSLRIRLSSGVRVALGASRLGGLRLTRLSAL